jgi:hypothetical protein
LGKPLISDAAMRSMFETMKHLRSLKSEPEVLRGLPRAARADFLVAPEALHAALLQQMHRRDTLVTQGVDTMANAALTAILRGYPALTSILQLIQEHNLSLLIVTQSEPETKAETHHRLSGTKVQILSVDDSDAVAVCRVVQESILRARHGWGGAVIHAARIAGATDAVEGMEQRLRRRGLLLDAV